jgi:hypothetical protein
MSKILITFRREQRLNTVKQHKLCENCLRATHNTESCNSGNCRQCHKRHNSLLHLTENANQSQELAATSSIVARNSVNMFNKLILLSTALIQVQDRSTTRFTGQRLAKSIKSNHNDFKSTFSCLVVGKITDNLPSVSINSNLNIPKNIKLADPIFNQSGQIDLLIDWRHTILETPFRRTNSCKSIGYNYPKNKIGMDG